MSTRRHRDLEFTFKGVANRHRVHILELLGRKPEQPVVAVADEVALDVRTVSEHLRKLMLAGLVMKKKDGNMVRHALTEKGKAILQFCRIAV